MNSHRVISKILFFWPEFSRRIGPAWPSVYWQLRDGLYAYASATSDVVRAKIASDLERLLDSLPGCTDLINLSPQRLRRDGIEPLNADEIWATSPEEIQGLMDRRLNQPLLRRHPDIWVAGQIQVHKQTPLTVCLAQEDTQNGKGISVYDGRSVQVIIRPNPGLEVIGERCKTLMVEEGRNSEWVVFTLFADRVGSHSFDVDFLSEGQLLASVPQNVVAIDGVCATQFHVSESTDYIHIGGQRLPHPDLLLRVTSQTGRLQFDLHFNDTLSLRCEGEILRSDPEAYRTDLIAKLEHLARQQTQKGDVLFSRELEKIGQDLYRKLFPLELRREYRRFRQKIRTIQIVSDEPWIPWELIKPYDDEDPEQVVDDDFLCMRYDLSRWLAPATPPASEIIVQSLACIVPEDSDLCETIQEGKMVRNIAKELNIEDCSPELASYAEVEALLRSQTPIQLWHFACHGDLQKSNADKSPLYLHDHYPLQPDDLVGEAQTHLKKDRPFVFLNACRSGASSLLLAGLSGWASVMVQECGVGAFLAPMWIIDDKLAYNFAETFYTAFLQTPGCTLAQALRKARHALRDQAPNNPIWLAYSLYSHPNARIAFPEFPSLRSDVASVKTILT